MKFHSDSSSQRIVKNGIFTAFQFGIYILSGIFFIPFLLRQYGSGTYGLIALAGFLTQYVGLLSRCIGNSTARFLNIALNKKDWKQANEIFSTALAANTGFILLQLPFFALGIWKLEWIIDFPPEVALDFRILVVCNVAVFFASLLSGVFITPIQAANRLDISATLDAIRLSLRLFLLFVLIKSVGAKLWLIGVVDVGLALAYGIVVFFLRRRLAQELVFKWELITKKWVRPVLNMAGWTVIATLGGYLFVKTDVWMINRFVSKEMAGIYAALLVWPNFLKQVSNQLASILIPVYLIDYAKGNSERVAVLSLFSAKLIGCFVAISAGGLCIAAKPLLELWMGTGAEAYVLLFRIMILYLTYTIGESVLWPIYITIDKVHFTGMVGLCAGVINIIASLILIRAGFGALGVATATAFSMTLAAGIAIPLGVCREFNIPYRTVWWNYLCATLLLFVSLGATAAAFFVLEYSIVYACIIFIVLLAGGVALVSHILFSDVEKSMFRRLLQRVFKRGLKEVGG
ncbi:MAG: hypothetical protein DRQ56_05880 [Gammaproteobacteria bacterium]|nr:MAG: hypothetical protein DRQ56_05880 [Gammaproteobacteria bacterium]